MPNYREVMDDLADANEADWARESTAAGVDAAPRKPLNKKAITFARTKMRRTKPRAKSAK